MATQNTFLMTVTNSTSRDKSVSHLSREDLPGNLTGGHQCQRWVSELDLIAVCKILTHLDLTDVDMLM